jgi:hypothetical protein
MLMLSEMAGVAARHLDEPVGSQRTVTATLDVVRDLVESGKVIVGDVVREPDGLLAVASWGLGPRETTTRIRSEWTAIGRLEGLGQVCWLELTDAGRAEAPSRRAR